MEAPNAKVALAPLMMPPDVVAYNGYMVHSTGILLPVGVSAPPQDRMGQYRDHMERYMDIGP